MGEDPRDDPPDEQTHAIRVHSVRGEARDEPEGEPEGDRTTQQPARTVVHRLSARCDNATQSGRDGCDGGRGAAVEGEGKTAGHVGPGKVGHAGIPMQDGQRPHAHEEKEGREPGREQAGAPFRARRSGDRLDDPFAEHDDDEQPEAFAQVPGLQRDRRDALEGRHPLRVAPRQAGGVLLGILEHVVTRCHDEQQHVDGDTQPPQRELPRLVDPHGHQEGDGPRDLLGQWPVDDHLASPPRSGAEDAEDEVRDGKTVGHH